MDVEEHIKTNNKLPSYRRLILNTLFSANYMNEKIVEVLKEFDISEPQFNVLRILRGQKGKPANLSTIQERMISRMSNTTRLVDKLIKKDLVKRVTCENNRRKVEITITPEGLKLLDKIDPVFEEAEKEVVKNLNEKEVETLIELLNKLRK
ncbi:MarR family winged helix-turn-helix transcriptional regulator [Salegentibacter chungangensis]|uniref:MarR family winged helix-turn-helix transcriptional regulator n=1 Tax=Salegentibacter chungangensis TaxID=1335724 RepID=A0ABW3NUY8_9FLAO